jgi:alkylation response protein AidB-like acyl-CoA dehydrogenase
MVTGIADVRDELRAVARDLLARGQAADGVPWRQLADSGWLGLEVPEELDGAGLTFAETVVVLEELGRAAVTTSYFGAAVLAAGTLAALEPAAGRDELLRQTASGAQILTAAVVDGTDDGLGGAVPFRIEDCPAGPRLRGHAGFVPDAAEAGLLLLLALDPAGTPVVVPLGAGTGGLTVTPQPVVDATRRFGLVRAEAVDLDGGGVLGFDGDPRTAVGRAGAGVAASMAKSYACAAAVEVAGTAMQLHGGMGYTWESGIHVYLKRATLNRSLFGSPAAHRRRLARRYT